MLSKYKPRYRFENILIIAIIVIAWYQLVVPYLSFNSVTILDKTYYTTMPFGGEYARSIAQFFVWDRMMECGTCALWAQNMGGFPVFNDYFSSFMHPFSFIFSVIFGGFRGATFTLAASFLLMGLATWWLMLLLGQSRVVQIWAPIVTMYGGQMTGRLETGTVGLPLSLASAMLVLAATVAFVQRVNVRNAVMLGVSMATLLLAGQLYMQLGTLLSLPVVLSYIQQEATLKEYLLRQKHYIILAILLTVLLVAPLLLTNIFEFGTTYKKIQTHYLMHHSRLVF